jgi:very-long-chain (3R)-3-hydroxyacyl-CoA dehydratase
MGVTSRTYLMLYNTVMAAGWSVVLVRLVSSLLVDSSDFPAAYAAVAPPLQIFQTGALLEILHSSSGLVRAPVATTAVQVASRLLLLWGVVEPIVGVRSYPFLATMVGAWSLTEIPRYAYFAYAAAFQAPPYALVWLRYSTFIPLYPIGAGSEWVLLFVALPFIKDRNLFSMAMPNKFNIAFNYYTFCVVALVFYIPGLPHMFSHMMSQRTKQLAKASSAGKAAVV